MQFFRGASIQLAPRHKSSGKNDVFASDGLSFADYVMQTRNVLHAVHGDAPQKIEGNAPFHLQPCVPSRRGIVLTHGLTDSPYFVRYLAEFFQEQGFHVYAPLLTGHGTQPGDLLNVSYTSWLKLIAYSCDCLCQHVDELYLAGFSAGGLLSLYHALQDERVRALLLFSPAMQISPRAAHANWHRWTSWLCPAQKWIHTCPDICHYKYESIPKNAAWQLYQLTQLAAQRLQQKRWHKPLFVALSDDDTTTNSQATLAFVQQQKTTHCHVVLYSSQPNITLENVYVEQLNSYLPEQRILSFSHTSIMLRPQDPYFGLGGEYINAIHYWPNQMDKYQACMRRDTNVWLGEVSQKNLHNNVIQRLMYNPYFAELTRSLACFLGEN